MNIVIDIYTHQILGIELCHLTKLVAMAVLTLFDIVADELTCHIIQFIGRHNKITAEGRIKINL